MLDHLPEHWPDVLNKVHKNREDFRFITIMAELARHVQTEHMSELLSLTQDNKNTFLRDVLISNIAKHLALEHLPELLEIVGELKKKRPLPLKHLAWSNSPDKRRRVLGRKAIQVVGCQ